MCLSPDKHKEQIYDFPYTRKFSIFSSMIGGLAFLSSNANLTGIILRYPQTLSYVSRKLPTYPSPKPTFCPLKVRSKC